MLDCNSSPSSLGSEKPETSISKSDKDRGYQLGSASVPLTARVHANESSDDYDIDFWEPKPPKVLMENNNAVPLELRSQIQLYATTE